MKKGRLITLLLLVTVFCPAHRGLANSYQVIHQPENSSLAGISNNPVLPDTTTAAAAISITCGTSTVTDADGNVYSTVLIGDQCWMGENLRVGTMIDGSVNQSNNGMIEKHCYNNSLANCNTYGGLYQWNELMQGGSQGICPAGWHIPSDGEWQWLATILAGSTGGKLKSTGTLEGGTGLWHTPNTGATNSSGFNALPGGWKDESGNFVNMGNNAFFFSASTWWYCCAYFRQLNYNDDLMYSNYTYVSNSLSVRCLKNPAILPTVSTSSVSGITATTAVCGGNITDDGGAEVLTRGVVWNTTQNPTLANHAGITADGAGAGVFTSNLTGLVPQTTYYVRAYATNSVGTAYGLDVEFTTPMASVLTLSNVTVGADMDTCFNANQTLTMTNFQVVTGGSATLIAGGKILVQPASHVAAGGYLHAYITTSQSYCAQPEVMRPLNSETITTEPQTADILNISTLFSLFPNPTTGRFTLEMHDAEAIQGIKVEILNMMGDRVYQAELSGSMQYDFDLAGRPKGVYILRVVSGDKMRIGKLIVK